MKTIFCFRFAVSRLFEAAFSEEIEHKKIKKNTVFCEYRFQQLNTNKMKANNIVYHLNLVKMKKIIFVLVVALNSLNAQKAVRLDVLTDITALSKGNGANLMAHIQSSFAPKIGLFGGYALAFDARQVGQYHYQVTSTKVLGEIRIYPFEERPKENRETIRCYSFGKKKQSVAHMLWKTLYIAPGFEQEQIGMTLTPNKELESPVKQFKFDIINKALTFNAGALLRFSRLSCGVSYRISIGKPYSESANYKIATDFLKTIHPSDYRIEQGFRLEAGFNF